MATMTKEEHIARHKELHTMLDKLVADMISHSKMLLSRTTVLELMEWSYKQTINPKEES